VVFSSWDCRGRACVIFLVAAVLQIGPLVLIPAVIFVFATATTTKAVIFLIWCIAVGLLSAQSYCQWVTNCFSLGSSPTAPDQPVPRACRRQGPVTPFGLSLSFDTFLQHLWRYAAPDLSRGAAVASPLNELDQPDRRSLRAAFAPRRRLHALRCCTRGAPWLSGRFSVSGRPFGDLGCRLARN
jgi:hypothetical protein